MSVVNLKKVRLSEKMTQTVLALKCGVSVNTIRAWENQVTQPSPDNLQKLLELFGDKIS